MKFRLALCFLIGLQSAAFAQAGLVQPNQVIAGPSSGASPAFAKGRSLVNADFPTSGATAGTYGSTTTIPQVQINAQGLVIGISSVTPAIPFTDLSGSLACGQLPALTGNVTTTAGSCATNLGAFTGDVSKSSGSLATTVVAVRGLAYKSGATYSANQVPAWVSGNSDFEPFSAASLTLTGQVVSGGATVTPNNLTAGTSFTVNCGLSPLQWIINNGAFTITAPTAANTQNCAVRVINGTTGSNAGAVTITTAQGWSGKSPGGASFSTTPTVSAASVTFTNSSANIGWSTSTPPLNAIVNFATTGTLPTNFAATTNYYVVSSSGTTIQVSATAGGSAIVAGSAGSGTQTGNEPSIFDLVVLNINSPPYAQWVQIQ